MKVRGPRKNVENFLMNGFDLWRWDKDVGEVKLPTEEFLSVTKYEYGTEIGILKEVHVADTRRAFVDDFVAWFDEDDEEDETKVVVMPFRQAWAINTEDFVKLSSKYMIDIKLFGIECGMEFCQEVEIANGKLLEYRNIEYTDWEWECPFPNMGG